MVHPCWHCDRLVQPHACEGACLLGAKAYTRHLAG